MSLENEPPQKRRKKYRMVPVQMREEILAYAEKTNMEQAGRHFGISPTAISKWRSAEDKGNAVIHVMAGKNVEKLKDRIIELEDTCRFIRNLLGRVGIKE